MKSKSGNAQFARLLRYFNIAAFLRWWGQGLLMSLPAGMRRWFVPLPSKLIIEEQGPEIVLQLEKDGIVEELERYPRDMITDGTLRERWPKAAADLLVLRLDASNVLTKKIALPPAAEANLHKVVGYEIDRLTPFSPDKIYYDVQVVARHASARGLQVKFTMVLSALLDDLLKQFKKLELMPDVVDVVGAGPTTNLLPATLRPRKGGVGRKLQWVLLTLILLAGLTAAALPLWQQRTIVIALLPKVQVAQQKAEAVVALRTQLKNAVESSGFLLQQRAEKVPTIDLMNELTAILPDSTWVEQFNIKGDAVEIRGQSLEAAALIGLVDSSEYFQGTTFRSPVVRDNRTGRDRFFLVTKIAKRTSGRALIIMNGQGVAMTKERANNDS